MNCPNCGNEVPETANVCGYCGHRFQRPAPTSSPQVNLASMPPKKTSLPKWAWIVFSLLIVCFACFCMVYGLPLLNTFLASSVSSMN
ncbi:MAG: zinc-ribbon domain-containing protein [Chloroflexi bacterium]|nr:zinc-ribbon domain-containing protein [Chloroflexota bacterium]